MISKEDAAKEDSGSSFTECEAEFLAENFLGTIATSSQSGQPHVVPVTYRFDGSSIIFGGWNLTKTLKFRNPSANNKVAFVVDDLVSTRQWKVRGVEVRGRAEPFQTDPNMTLVKITPTKVRSWGLG